MKSSLTFHPTCTYKNDELIERVKVCLEWAADVSEASSQKVEVMMQHRLKEDEFVMVVEVGAKTFASHKTSPRAVLNDVSKQLFKYYEKITNESNKEEERVAREKGRRGRGRKSTAGKRRS